MDAQQLKALIDAMAASDLAEMEARKDGWVLRLVRRPADGAHAAAARLGDGASLGRTAEPAEPADPSLSWSKGVTEQCAALAGTVFLTPSPAEPPFVQPGQAVKAGQTLCVIEAMKVFNEVAAERDGVVDAFLVASGEDVSAGQPLVRLR